MTLQQKLRTPACFWKNNTVNNKPILTICGAFHQDELRCHAIIILTSSPISLCHTTWLNPINNLTKYWHWLRVYNWTSSAWNLKTDATRVKSNGHINIIFVNRDNKLITFLFIALQCDTGGFDWGTGPGPQRLRLCHYWPMTMSSVARLATKTRRTCRQAKRATEKNTAALCAATKRSPDWLMFNSRMQFPQGIWQWTKSANLNSNAQFQSLLALNDA